MKKGIVLLTALAMTAGSLTACGGGGASTQTSGQTAASGAAESAKASADGKTEITFWHYMSEDKEGKYIRRERYAGSCSRSFYIGEGVTQDEIRARFEDGILRLTVPKKDKKQVEENKYISIEG